MFDDVIKNHNVRKIEQNNDVYCVASGVPDVTNKHTMCVSDFLLEIMGRIPTLKIWSLPDVSIQVRAGAHTGTYSFVLHIRTKSQGLNAHLRYI